MGATSAPPLLTPRANAASTPQNPHKSLQIGLCLPSCRGVTWCRCWELLGMAGICSRRRRCVGANGRHAAAGRPNAKALGRHGAAMKLRHAGGKAPLAGRRDAITAAALAGDRDATRWDRAGLFFLLLSCAENGYFRRREHRKGP
jgi:hypothetical protein